MIANESINTEREKANLLCLIKLTLNTLIDQSSSPTAPPVLDDRNTDVTNFILTLERVLNFRMKANWLSERRFFWDFIRPACIGSARQSFIERVEDVSKTRSIKDKGRTWIKFALMEKKLSELLKLVISDCNLMKKFYYDDSIMTSNQSFILCDQLAGLCAIDFSFCFKQDGPILTHLLHNSLETDVIDLTPFLSYKSKHIKELFEGEENTEPISVLTSMNELKPLNQADMVPLDKYKLEVEQRKYFEDLLRHRDREIQQIKNRYELLKRERDHEVRLMENIIIELQLELRTAREDAEFKRKKSQQSISITPPKSLFKFTNRKINSPTTPTNNQHEDIDTQMRSVEATNIIHSNDSENLNSKPTDFQSSRRSSHSTTTTNTDDDQYDLARQITSNPNPTSLDIKPISSPEMISSATSLSTSSSSNEDELLPEILNKPIGNESGRFEPIEVPIEQTNLLEEASNTNA